MDTATPVNGRVIPSQASPPGSPAVGGVEPAETSENSFESVEKLQRDRDEKAALAEIQEDEAFDAVLSRKEMKARRRDAERVRRRQREHATKRALRQVDEDAREATAVDKIAKQDRIQRIDLAKAKRLRDQLTDGGKNLASVYRHQRFVRIALGATSAVGIVWTSYNVGTGLGGGNVLYFGVEPLFSVPLMTIVVMQMVAALNGRLNKVAPTRFDENGKRKLTAVGWIEVGLLLGTTIIGVSPSIAEIVDPNKTFNGSMLVVRLLAPSLIVVSVVLQLVAAELFGDIIRDAHLAGDGDDDTLRSRIRAASALIRKIQADVAAGDLAVDSETGLPAISAIQKRYAVAKVVAQAARDSLPLFAPTASTEAQR